jgi:hypothetical protein
MLTQTYSLSSPAAARQAPQACDQNVGWKMVRSRKRVRSKQSPDYGTSGTNSPNGVVKSDEEALKQWAFEAQALFEPGQFDPVKAGRLKTEMDVMMLAVQRAEADQRAASEKEYFDWLAANIPEMFNTQGRPHWIESAEIISKDKALLDSFDDKLNRNIAAKTGKKHGASKKTYADLADEFGIEDAETVKQRVMRARRRQIALQQTIQDIKSVADQAKTLGAGGVSPKQAIKNRKKLLEAFWRILRVK